MWLFLPTGFVSIVANKHDPDGPELLVRARCEAHLRAFVGPDHPFTLQDGGGSDYRWRTWMTRQAVEERIADHVRSMTYGNFKNSIPCEEGAYHDACMDVWGAMHRLQTRMTAREAEVA